MIKNKFFNSKTFSDKYGNLYCHIKKINDKEKKITRNFEKLENYKKKISSIKKQNKFLDRKKYFRK